MSSLGGQWRVLRHYVSSGALHAELDKLLRRLKPSAPDHWDHIIKKLERAISVRLSQDAKELQLNKGNTIQNASTAHPAEEQTQAPQPAEKTEQLSNAPNVKPPGALSVGSEAKEITIEGLLQGLKLKKDLHFGKISQPGWKNNKPIVTKTSIHSRTSYVVSALAGAGAAGGEGAACLRKRAEDFIAHVNQYPEARDFAIKEGVVRVLLRAQARLPPAPPAPPASPADDDVAGVLDEALALLGYCAPTLGPGPNILSLDGGGIRGLIAIEVLRHLERLTGRRVNQLFDYIIGVSTGAIIAAVIGGGVGNLDTASKLYHTLSKEMFGNTSVIGGASRLVWSHSYYDTAAWEKMLQDNLGDCMLTHCNRKKNPKMALVSCVVGAGAGGGAGTQRLAPFLFRTYSCGFRTRGAVRGTTRAKVWHAVRASAAAPTYFQEFHQDGLVHQDGGLMVNNPAGVGLGEARLLWGGAALAQGTLLSLGTGQALAPSPSAAPSHPRAAPATPGTSWKDKFNTILDSATDTEGVHLLLNELLPHGSYFRFNPPLMSACAMDEVDPRRLADLLADTHAYIRRNQHKFEQAARRLTRRRSLLQRASDELKRRALLLGLTRAH